VRWIVQNNLGTSGDAEEIAEACKNLGIKYTLVHRIPFSTELPNIPTDESTLFYGSTRFVNLAYESKKWTPCAYFDPIKFTASHWLPAYGEMCLNNDSKFTTLAEFCFEPHNPERLFFVRPDKDLKEFQGGVWSFSDLQRWKTGLLKTDLGDKQLAHIPILVGEPWGITREWRLFMVEGKIIEASQYRKGHILNVSSCVPHDVHQYAKTAALTFSPHDVFVLDICESANNLYVLEIGCVNSAGFYTCNIHNIVKTITEYCDRRDKCQL